MDQDLAKLRKAKAVAASLESFAAPAEMRKNTKSEEKRESRERLVKPPSLSEIVPKIRIKLEKPVPSPQPRSPRTSIDSVKSKPKSEKSTKPAKKSIKKAAFVPRIDVDESADPKEVDKIVKKYKKIAATALKVGMRVSYLRKDGKFIDKCYVIDLFEGGASMQKHEGVGRIWKAKFEKVDKFYFIEKGDHSILVDHGHVLQDLLDYLIKKDPELRDFLVKRNQKRQEDAKK